MNKKLCSLFLLLMMGVVLVGCKQMEDVPTTQTESISWETKDDEAGLETETVGMLDSEVAGSEKVETETEAEEVLDVVASGILADGAIEWKIVGTVLYITGEGAIPDFSKSGKWLSNFGEQFPEEKPVAWQMYYELVDEIVVSEGITSFGKNNFSFFGKVTSFRFPSTLKSIGEEAMMWMGLTSLNFPESLTTIEHGALQGLTSLTSVVFPGTIKKIPSSCFTGCYSLREIIIEDGVEEIGKGAFGIAECYDLDGTKRGGTHGFNIYIPDSVTFIDEDAIFAGGFDDSEAKVYASLGSCAEEWVRTCGLYRVSFVENGETKE